jgi:hypothetical protein
MAPAVDLGMEAVRCSHSLCMSGAKLDPACDPCAAKICSSDDYCCNVRWSSVCVSEIASTCGNLCGPTPDLAGTAGRDLATGVLDLSSPPGTIGPGGGDVDHLYFAVTGDSRPGTLDDTANYPTAVIQKIYADIEGMSPRPQFVVATGDYMFASTAGAEAAKQIDLYAHAMQSYKGTVFAAMGNHECDGYTAHNCTAATNNYNAFMDTLVRPLGKSLPYYTIPISATDGSFTAKVVVLACNAWDSTQKAWLASQLAMPTKYTIVVRHEPASADTGPCVVDAENLLAKNPYNLSIVGHTHSYRTNGKEIVVGHGGAPLSSGTYGYATVEQTASGFRITNYDYASAAPLASVMVPF